MDIQATAWYALILLAAAALFWMWRWNQRQTDLLRDQHRRLRGITARLAAASQPREIEQILREELPKLAGPVESVLYSYHREHHSLETPGGGSIPIHSPNGEAESSIALVFRNKMPARWRGATASTVQAVPLEINDQVLGVLTLEGVGAAKLDPGDLRHVGLAAASILASLDRQKTIEQRLRQEKLSATGQFIEGLIRELVELREQPSRIEPFIGRLVSLAQSGKGDAEPLNLRPLLVTLIREHRDLWRAQGLRVTEQFEGGDGLVVLASANQLEQILRLVLAASAEAAIEGDRPEIRISARLADRHAQVSFTIPEGASSEANSRFLLARTLLQATGGDLRHEFAEGTVHYEIQLPLWAGQKISSGIATTRAVVRTALVLDPDEIARRQLVASLSRRSIRAVPVDSFDQALDQLERFRFDLFFCASQATGGDWASLRARLLDASHRFETPGRIVILTEPEEEEMARSLESLGVMVSQRSSGELEMARLLSS